MAHSLTGDDSRVESKEGGEGERGSFVGRLQQGIGQPCCQLALLNYLILRVLWQNKLGEEASQTRGYSRQRMHH